MSGFAKGSKLDTLIVQRDNLEAEAEGIASELTSPGPNGERPAGIKDALVDAEGFPRSDVDIFRVREQRNRLACINTDHKALMKEIEAEMFRLHESLLAKSDAEDKPEDSGSTFKSSESSSSGDNMKSGTPMAATASTMAAYESLSPIGKISELADNSPAKQANLKDNDHIIAFGPITIVTHGNVTNAMSAIASIVKENEPITLVIDRNGKLMQLNIVPKKWEGRGILGCRLSRI